MDSAEIKAFQKAFAQLQAGDHEILAAEYTERMRKFSDRPDLKNAQKFKNKQGLRNIRKMRKLGDQLFILCVFALSARKIILLDCALAFPRFKSWWGRQKCQCSPAFEDTIKACITATPAEFGK